MKINKWRKKLKFSSRKNRKNRHVLHVRVLGIRQSVRGLVFAVHCFFFVILKLGVMGLSVLYCGTTMPDIFEEESDKEIVTRNSPAHYGKPSLPKAYRLVNTGPNGFQYHRVRKMIWSVLEMYR